MVVKESSVDPAFEVAAVAGRVNTRSVQMTGNAGRQLSTGGGVVYQEE